MDDQASWHGGSSAGQAVYSTVISIYHSTSSPNFSLVYLSIILHHADILTIYHSIASLALQVSLDSK